MSEPGSDRSVKVDFRLPCALLEEVEDAVDRGEFRNRSEALRSAVRLRFSPSRQHTVEFAENERRIRADGSGEPGTYQIELPEDDVIGAIAALTLYAKDTPLEENYKSIARSIEEQAREQGLTHPTEEDDGLRADGSGETGSEQQRRSELPGAGLLESTDLDFGGTTENVIEPVVVECPLASEGLTSYSVRIQYRAVEGEVPEIESLGAFVRAFEDVPATQEELTEHVFETLSEEFGFASFCVEVSGTHDGVATTTRRER